jgi:hypothetical protein
MAYQASATPFQRPDHKAKPHPRPTKWTRPAVARVCYEAVAIGLGVEE